MLRRYSKARSAVTDSINEDISNSSKSSSVEVYEKRVQQLSTAIEESQKNTNQVSLKRHVLSIKMNHYFLLFCGGSIESQTAEFCITSTFWGKEWG